MCLWCVYCSLWSEIYILAEIVSLIPKACLMLSTVFSSLPCYGNRLKKILTFKELSLITHRPSILCMVFSRESLPNAKIFMF